jgi:MT0933-like antitoxin protein
MGLGDKFKNLAKQAQDSAAEHKEQLRGAVEAVGVAADRKTKGRHTDKIARMGQKANDALDRLGDQDSTADGGERRA